MKEEWRDINKYKGIYQVSNLGRVKSLPRNRVKKERFLSYRPNNRGYNRINLTKNNKSKDFLIHRLVAEAFIPNINNFDTVDHIDNDKNNNCVDNLQWMNGICNWRKNNVGEDNPNSKMTKEKVEKIRNLYKSNNYTQKKLGEIFNISKSQVSVIINNKNWKYEETH
jgi:predicted XRE-type DNA-binding protein